MASPRQATILIIEPDEPTRAFLRKVIRRAGFRVECLAALSPRDEESMRDFDVIIRDCDGSPARLASAVRELSATASEVLQKTIVTTTSSSCAFPPSVHAVLQKPYDLSLLLQMVRSRASVSGDPLLRFAGSLEGIRSVLQRSPESTREMLLRNEMRRAMTELSETLGEAAALEAAPRRSKSLRLASRVASSLASGAPSRSADGGH